MEFDMADPPLPIMEFSIIFFLNEGFPNPEWSDTLFVGMTIDWRRCVTVFV